MSNVEMMIEDLLTDQAIAESRAVIRYGVRITPKLERWLEQQGIVVVEHQLGLTAQSRPRLLRIICLRSIAHYKPFRLRHACGIGAMRHKLGAHAHQWKLQGLAGPLQIDGKFGDSAVPDAIWYATRIPVSVEYDAGSHRLSTARSKMIGYGTHPQVWGCATEARLRTLQRVSQSIDAVQHGITVIFVRWR